MSILNRLFRRRPKPVTPTFNAPIRPDQPFFAVGDVHGCIGLLEKLLESMKASGPGLPIIFVGDYVDRGEDSADVLRKLHQMHQDPSSNVICLAGNHEDMFLKFLDDPEKHGERWLRYGGLQTLASFGIQLDKGPGAMRQMSEACAEAMGGSMVSWLRDLPTSWQTGNVAVVHASADPFVPMDQQKRRHLMWGHAEFETAPRHDGIWVLHGHTIVDAPTVENGRIGIDTGAYATGRLTAARVEPEGVTFLTA